MISTATRKIEQKNDVYRKQFRNELEKAIFLHNEDDISLYRNIGSSIQCKESFDCKLNKIERPDTVREARKEFNTITSFTTAATIITTPPSPTHLHCRQHRHLCHHLRHRHHHLRRRHRHHYLHRRHHHHYLRQRRMARDVRDGS